MFQGVTQSPHPTNEPVLSYAPGTRERAELVEALQAMQGAPRELTMVVDGKSITTGNTHPVRAPHKHSLELGVVHDGTAAHVEQAIIAAQRAKHDWAALSFDDRAAIFLKAADLLAGPWRAKVNAATMLGQSKTAHQAEIDAACELVDFWRFNVHFARDILAQQPQSAPGTWNRMDYRPLDGFVLAITPFNFTSIAGNLPTAPALMGNTVVWKPAQTQAFSAQVLMDVLLAAGLPPGVINLVHAPGSLVGKAALPHPDLGGVHFTGSTGVFQSMWRAVGENISNYRSYPRLVGETGGKDFVFAHPSADVGALAVALVRGAFEYQGQKCSAASRAYIPESLWKELSGRLEAMVGAIKMGDVTDFGNFMGAVIDERSFAKIKGHLDAVREGDSGAKIWLGGGCDDREGYFIAPTVVLAQSPRHTLMTEELFGPVLTLYRYRDDAIDETLDLVDSTSPYALTGAVFAQDRQAVAKITERLRFAAGNFYVNDKPTGAVVAQQPFGGARASGTNDKAGSPLNLYRWISARVIKETFVPPQQWTYPFMGS